MDDRGYECVDPTVGNEIWRLEDPRLDAGARAGLDAHLAVCDACRLRRAASSRVAAGLRAGELILESRSEPRSRPLALGGGVLLAACLALLVILPPRPRDAGLRERAAGDLRFDRPVEGEVVARRGLQLRWRSVPGVSGYRIVVEQVGEAWRWLATSTEAGISLPDSVTLAVGRDYRARVEPVPADLAPLGGVTVSFRAGALATRLLYRLTAMPAAAAICGATGLPALIAAGILRRRRRKAPG